MLLKIVLLFFIINFQYILWGEAFVYDTASACIKYQPSSGPEKRASFGSTVAIIFDNQSYSLAIGAPFDDRSPTATKPSGLIYICPIDYKLNNCKALRPRAADLRKYGYTKFGSQIRYARNASSLQVLQPIKSVTIELSTLRGYTSQNLDTVEYDNIDTLPEDITHNKGREGEMSTWAYDAMYMMDNKWMYVTPFAILGTGAIGMVDRICKFNDTNNPFIQRHVYAGSSMSKGRVFDIDPNVVTIAVGAPGVTTENEKVPERLGSGVVAILNIAPSDVPANFAQFLGVVVGPHYGSSFGRSVLLLDVNGDGYDDLLVGVPFYVPDKNVSRTHKWVDGAVFIYLNDPMTMTHKNGNSVPFKKTPQILRAQRRVGIDPYNVLTKNRFNQFGIALTSLGDLDHDGCQDFAVSAPYEGNGTVYIYLGSNSGVIGPYSQRITGNDFSPALIGLGTSMDASLDVDGNQYQDLLIGAMESERVVLLRSRPVIRFYSLSLLPQKLIGAPHLEDSHFERCPFSTSTAQPTCLKLYISAFYHHVDGRTCDPYDAVYDVNYVLTADYNQTKPRAVVGNKKETGIVKAICRPFQRGDENRSATDRALSVFVAFKKDTFTDLVKPVVFRLEMNANIPSPPSPTSKNQELVDLTPWPTYDKSRSFSQATVFIAKDCRPERKCPASLDGRFTHTLESVNNQLQMRIGGEALSFTITASVKNRAALNSDHADAHQVVFHVKPSLMRALTLRPHSDAQIKEFEILCSLANPLAPGEERTCSLTFDLAANVAELGIGVINLDLFITTNEDTPMIWPIAQRLEIHLKMEADIKLNFTKEAGSTLRYENTKIIGANKVDHLRFVGEELKLTFRLINHLNTTFIPSSTVTFLWPIEVSGYVNEEHGKFLLYFVSLHLSRGANIPLICDENTRHLWNTMNYSDFQQIRLANWSLPAFGPVTIKNPYNKPKLKPQKRSNLTAHLTCFNGYARCVPIVCKLGAFSRRTGMVEITLRARMWQYTFIEDFEFVPMVNVTIDAFWAPEGSYEFVFNDKSETGRRSITVEILNNMKPRIRHPENLYLIVAGAVLLGLLILGIIFLILYRCNFFKRKKIRMQVKAPTNQQSRISYSPMPTDYMPGSPMATSSPYYNFDSSQAGRQPILGIRNNTIDYDSDY